MPSPSEERPVPPPGSAEEALRRLELRLDRASEAAERLMAEAAAAAAGVGSPPSEDEPPTGADPEEPAKPPPAGWQIPEDARAGTAELDPFVALVQALRDLVPPELQRRLVAAIRELLLALRALIDWYLERLERRREQAVEVQDIPIL
ncbi:MAG TPA: hypothetical protein VFH80_35790 [Solirubrobacteraceae bacterium]|nr:hypothetical protein [Solirubrobacteraceae bacterium]